MSKKTVGDVMTMFPHSIDKKDTVSAALKLMQREKIRHLPVMSEGRPRSIITEREINLVLSLEDDPDAKESLLVEEVAAIEAYTVDFKTSLIEVLNEMAKRHIGSVVVTAQDRLAGIFTSVDACREFARFLSDR